MHHSAPSHRGAHRAPERGLRFSPWIIVTLLALPTAGCAWFLIASLDPLPIDVWWHDVVAISPDSFLFTVASVLHVVGSTKTMAGTGLVITLACFMVRRWREGIAIAVTLLGVLTLVVSLKALVGRPRPLNMLVEQAETSFPSGHSLGGAALMTILVCIIAVHSGASWIRITAISLASAYIVLMMWSRTALQVHWLSDTVCAASLGVALALVVAQLVLKFPVPPVEKAAYSPQRSA